MSAAPFTPPLILVFAPSDPTGAAGVQSALLTCASMGCHALSVTTALSVQDSMALEALEPVDAELIDQQARALLEDMPVAAFSVGLLPDTDIITTVAEILADYDEIPLIIELAPLPDHLNTLEIEDCGAAILDLLVPQATVLMVSSDEVSTWLQWLELDDGEAATPAELAAPSPSLATTTLAAHERLAAALIERGSEYVLITGVGGPLQEVQNVLISAEGVVRTDRWPRLAGSFSGAGATLCAGMAALIANGLDVPEAGREAQEYTWQALSAGFRPGMGRLFPDRFFWAREIDTPDPTV